MLARFISYFFGVIYVDLLFHQYQAQAFGFPAQTTGERLGVLAFAGAVTLLFYFISWRFFPPSFFHGVLIASGFFATFDIIVIHWIFHLHRLTYGPEAFIIELLLVITGFGMLAYGLIRERKTILEEKYY